ncbi:sensor domain-containing protein [Ralstonia insidiosa]|uniref:EAL domain-containing protein n=1 Tax=Ralstonia insidiosa TaxID=190721 RepID=A0A848NQD5_9RALS|nr:EAL domain-containing protein [Ralstonia insidiosa]NMV37322.1 EAL domain-containing protein [Ralstonia insidiosa]
MSTYQRILDVIPDGLLVVGEEGGITECNRQAEIMFGYAQGELVGTMIDALVPSRFSNHAKHRRQYSGAPRTRSMGALQDLLARRKDDSEFPVEVMLCPISDLTVLCIVRDVTDRRQIEGHFRGFIESATDAMASVVSWKGARNGDPAGIDTRIAGRRYTDRLQSMVDTLLPDSVQQNSEMLKTINRLIYVATCDTLTGLPSRGVLLSKLKRVLARNALAGVQVAVLFIDLDNFKLVNDSFGHDFGDQLLREIAQRIESCVTIDDMVSRFGGDELVILHAHASGGSEGDLAKRVLAALAEPFKIESRDVVMSASIGIATGEPGARSAEQLLGEADTALYAAKRSGKNRAERFSETLHARAVRRMRIVEDLREALHNENLYVVYQPQVNLTTGHMVGVEALVRWQHPEFGSMSPVEFIPIAEEAGLIYELGRQVLQSACKQLTEWAAVSPTRPLTLTVNISPYQLGTPGFIEELHRIISETGISPSLLCLELTESALMGVETDIVTILEQVRRMGLYVAIDDFGTGHSSLARLRDLPVEVLKIDRSFIDGLPSEPGDTTIVSSILSLAFAMGKHVIAEGIEQVDQVFALRSMGCMVAQGHLFSRPVEPARILEMLGQPVWQPSLHREARASASSFDTRPARHAYRSFVDEFLDHIGVPMSGNWR